MLNRKKFADAIRPLFGGRMTTPQWQGVENTLNAWDRHGDGDDRKLAYVLATKFHETGQTMQPVRETFAKSDKAAIANLEKAWKAGKLGQVKTPYWRDGWFGRGDVQLTHEDNYETMGKRLGLDLVGNPSLALDPVHAADICVVGMCDGLFTGKKLSQYFSKAKEDPKGARYIVNGQDRAAKIAGYYEAFLAALEEACKDNVVVPLPKPKPKLDREDGSEEEEQNPAAPPPAPSRPVGVPDTVLKGVQEKLRQLGYYEVGDPDGQFGDRTKDAIMIFRRRNGLPLSTEIDDQFLAALETASKKPVAKERAETTEKEAAEKGVPAVKQSLRQRLAAFWAAIVAFLGTIVTAIGDAFNDVWNSDLFMIGRDAFSAVPVWAWLALAGGAALFVYYNANKAAAESTEAFNRGRTS